jgi:protein-S-isoprenylcysteine O-methyltransferase Ste14
LGQTGGVLLTVARVARLYFALQAVSGVAWWIGVFTVPIVRTVTLGLLDPWLVAVFDIPLFVVASALAAGLPARPARVAAISTSAWTVFVTTLLAFYATVTGEAGWGVLLMAGASMGSTAALSLLLIGHIPTKWLIAGPFAFRQARSRRTPSVHVAATLAQITVFWGVCLGVIPLILALAEQRWGLAADLPVAVPAGGAVLFVLASSLGLWSAVAINVKGDGTPLPSAMPNRLVIAGPYRVIRNPMAVSGIAQGIAIGLMLSSWLVIVYAVLGSLVWNYAIRPWEEADLEARFGNDYRLYRDNVRCWLPRLGTRASQ